MSEKESLEPNVKEPILDENAYYSIDRYSRIKKSIERIYNIAPYESLKIVVGIEEEIQWETLKERRRKSEDWTKILTDDFNKTVQDIFKDQNVSEKKVFIKSPEKTQPLDEIDDKINVMEDLDSL